MPSYTLRKRINPELLPVLARAQWALAAHVMRVASGGDIVAKAALGKFREMAKFTEDLVELQEMTGGEVHIVAFYDRDNLTFTERQILEWAVEFYVDETENGPDTEWHAALTLAAAFAENEWKEFGQ